MDHHSEEITKFNSHLSTLQFRIDELTARSDVMEQRVGAVEKNLMNALECFTGLAQRVTALETSDVCKDDSDDSEDSNASVVHYRFEDAYREQHGHEAWEKFVHEARRRPHLFSRLAPRG